jgi:hypothetical protein
VAENDLVQIAPHHTCDLFLQSFAFAFEIAKVAFFLALLTTCFGTLFCELGDLVIFADRARCGTTGIWAVGIHPVHAIAPAHIGLRHLRRTSAECENQSNPSFELHVVSLERLERSRADSVLQNTSSCFVSTHPRTDLNSPRLKSSFY